MTFPERIAIASRNPHKLREIREICADWPVMWITVKDHPSPWPEVEEPHGSYRGNAYQKARTVAATLDVPAIADDSGIEVDVLDGAPGPRSARFAGESASDIENLRKLVDAIRDVLPEQRTARYRCVAAIAWPDGRGLSTEGTCEGSLILEPRGRGGFGYDPIFVPSDLAEGERPTMAELPSEQKHRISHRGRAFRALGAELAR